MSRQDSSETACYWELAMQVQDVSNYLSKRFQKASDSEKVVLGIMARWCIYNSFRAYADFHDLSLENAGKTMDLLSACERCRLWNVLPEIHQTCLEEVARNRYTELPENEAEKFECLELCRTAVSLAKGISGIVIQTVTLQ